MHRHTYLRQHSYAPSHRLPCNRSLPLYLLPPPSRAGSEPSSGSRSTLSDLGPSGRIYRLGSVGQDCQMCLWDMQPFGEGDVAATPGAQGHK